MSLDPGAGCSYEKPDINHLRQRIAPEWVYLFPKGRITARDGREFALADAAIVICEFEAGKVDLSTDYEHQADKPEARPTGPGPAQIRSRGSNGRIADRPEQAHRGHARW